MSPARDAAGSSPPGVIAFPDAPVGAPGASPGDHLLPVPPGAPPRQRPAEALEALGGQIPGPGRFYVVSDGVLGVLSLPAVSVWTNGRVLWWATADGEMTLAACGYCPADGLDWPCTGSETGPEGYHVARFAAAMRRA